MLDRRHRRRISGDAERWRNFAHRTRRVKAGEKSSERTGDGRRFVVGSVVCTKRASRRRNRRVTRDRRNGRGGPVRGSNRKVNGINIQYVYTYLLQRETRFRDVSIVLYSFALFFILLLLLLVSLLFSFH